MSGGGDVRVLRQEAGQESPRMPAWKREILERRKAKGGGGAGASAETSPVGGGGPQRLNGEASGSVNGGGGGGGAGSGRNYSITTASQHFSHNKETRPERTPSREEDEEERLVFQESLGPLEENPFMKLEKERRRRQDRESAARPVQHILELYGSVPGIRTIRAENIIIIESDPDYFPEDGADKAGAKWQTNGVSGYSSLNDLLDRRGSAVTEIRAKEVVIYDTTLSRSEENLSTLGHQDLPCSSAEAGLGQGRVSRMLQKFDSNYGKLQKKSHSTENLLDLDCSPTGSSGARTRLWRKSQPPDPVPKPGLGSQPSSPTFQTPWSPTAKPPPGLSDPGSPHRATGPPLVLSPTRSGRDEPDRGQSKPTRERDWEGAEVPPKPKVPCSPETRRARAESPSSPVPSKLAARSTPDFEIRPAPVPDLQRIPEGDAQARALANLRLQSRNSFTVIPKRRLATNTATPTGPIKSSPSHRGGEVPAQGVPTSPTLTPALTPSKEKEVERVTPKPQPSPVGATSPTRYTPPTPEPLSPSTIRPPTPSSLPALPSPPPSPTPSPTPSSPVPEQPLAADQLPVTNIDEVEVEPPRRFPVPSPLVQRRKGNTFTVVPKRRAEPETQPDSPEPPQDTPVEASPGSTPPQAPYAHLGSQLKKRYPGVDEIQVIGGYLSLDKSCLVKTGSTGKKLKISFNESRLQSTYEYPSESIAWDSGEEDEDDRPPDAKMADDQPSMVGRIHIPRASYGGSPTHPAANSNNDLSSYIPKHSVDFSAWQEHKQETERTQQDDATAQRTHMTEEVMLTPADSSSLSDYSSEPALYF